ncbi:methylenetetrahydrofolate reductase [Microbaculum marinisediminis]|uniref:Methylenetetrahydrofolate reductase n=1 Tax=Microbaculum marinisediminis TaxID=2931392 RepID=A0AAW5R3D9_9HYPH|nr:methylenetetrahydrofolate reductase [Microbaculum sp. A6E488]MCT8974786.1 methylenetetrahydrofolate reductase [Microbaculum sp. A6E488]
MAEEADHKSNLQTVLEAGHFAITAELVPPAATDPRLLLDKAMPLKGLADAVNVTDGAGARSHMCSLASAALLAGAGVEPVMQMTCRDRNRIAIQSDLMGAAALGIRNLLILRGDDPTAGDQPDAKPVFDLDSRGLTETVIGIRDRRELPSGREVKGDAPFFIGAADMPIDPAPDWTPDGLAAKVAGGAQFVQTQFCMDPEVVRRYVARLADHGLTDKVHVLIGVAPLASARSAIWMRDKLFGVTMPEWIVERMERAADPKAEGRTICVELLQQLAGIDGVAGAHIMAPLNEASIPEVIERSGLIRDRRA